MSKINNHDLFISHINTIDQVLAEEEKALMDDSPYRLIMANKMADRLVSLSESEFNAKALFVIGLAYRQLLERKLRNLERNPS